MKKLIPFLLMLCIISSNNVLSQGVLNRVRNSVVNGVLGDKPTKNSSNSKPEPQCASDKAKLIIDLSRFSIDYSEASLCYKDDGSILIHDRKSGKYYVYKDDLIKGPYENGDPETEGFDCGDKNNEIAENDDKWVTMFPEYISRSDDKYIIKINGKTYGPYAQINDFAVPKSRDKFAAIVTEKILFTKDDLKKMEEAMKNAKTDQERLELAAKYNDIMLQNMGQGNPSDLITPKMVSDVPGATFDQMQWLGSKMNSTAKYDEIVIIPGDKVISLQGKTLITLRDGTNYSGQFYVSSSNTRYARYAFGTLTFSDNSVLSELFNPSLTKKAGNVYLSYMYYSPGKNAIMQNLISF